MSSDRVALEAVQAPDAHRAAGSIRMPTRWRPSAVRAVETLLLVAGLLATGCGSRDGAISNVPPHVELTGSPVDGDSVNYAADLYWHGWDDDGAVVRFEYAVDIPHELTDAQIDDPATPGIDWTTTTNSHVRIHFRAATPESLDSGSGVYPTNRASDPHTFFVRAYDNEGAHSTVADRSFNAWTTLPRTTITEPDEPYWGVYLTAGRSLTVRWTALDPDGREPNYPVARTEYKLIPVPSVLGIMDANHIVHEDPGPNHPWLPAPADSAGLTLALDPPNAYVLALRSIDEAGGVESRFEFWRNALLVGSSGGCFPGRPTLQIHDPLLGSNVFPNDGTVVDYMILAGTCLNFDMLGDAQSYGGTIVDYRWCVDAADGCPEEGTPAGCVPWGNTRTLPPICFATPGIHAISFCVRSTGCSGIPGLVTTSGTLRLQVLARDFHRDVLYVDDIPDPGADAESDRRFLAALHGAGFSTVDTFSAWGDGDLDGTVTPPSLAMLSRYRLVFWAVRGAGGGSQPGQSALLLATSCLTGRSLQAYVAAGGGVWIHGETVFGALKSTNSAPGFTCRGITSYGNDLGVNFDRGDFVTDFLQILGGDFRTARNVTAANGHGLVRALPTARALAEGFPVLEADSTTFPYQALGGLPAYDAMFQPTFFPGGGLDTLYTAEPSRTQSAFRGKPIAWRYADTSALPRQGPVAITSFPLQKMKEGVPSGMVGGARVPGSGLQGLVEALGAWFRAHPSQVAP